MVNLVIDGTPVRVPRGTKVILAAEQIGIRIPRFCYHAQLEPIGACRLCLVHVELPVIDRATGRPAVDETGEPVYRPMPTPQTSCTLECSEGMRVITDSEAVRKDRAAIIEFLLANHPLDCPICDKGGECELQEMTLLCGPGRQVYQEPRTPRDKARRIGANIVLDQERCIVCFRCTRFQDEWADEQVWSFTDRGHGNEIEPAFGEVIEKARFAGNTIELCPVGALTSDAFRFSARPWELADAPGVCPHCSVGCNLILGGRLGRLCRVQPRVNYHVNDTWICDRGRYDYEWVQEGRLVTPLIRHEGRQRKTFWRDGLNAAAGTLRQCERPAVVVAPSASCETGYMAQRLARAALGTNAVYVDDAFDQAGAFAGTIMQLLYTEFVLLISADILEDQPILWLRLNRRKRLGKLRMAVAAPRGQAADQKARAWRACDLEPGREVELLEALDRTLSGDAAGPDSGVPDEWLDAVLGSLRDAKSVAVILGPLSDGRYAEAREALGRLVARLQEGRSFPVNHGFLVGGANSRGLRLAGCAPAVLPGGAETSDAEARRRLEAEYDGELPRDAPAADWRTQVLSGQCDGLVLVGGDPLGEAAPEVLERVEALRSVVYVGVNENATSWLSTVALPEASFQEAAGSYVNFEGRLQFSEPTNEPIRDALPACEILGLIGERLGLRHRELSARTVRAEMAEVSEALRAWTETLPSEGKLLK